MGFSIRNRQGKWAPAAIVATVLIGWSAGPIRGQVPSEDDWTGPACGAWSTSGNWTLAGTTTQRVPRATDTASFVNPALAGTISLSGTQNAGSLWFDSSSPYTLSGGSTAALALSSTGTIWIGAGEHTIAAPLVITGSLTVDAESSAIVGPSCVGLVISSQVSGTGALMKIGPGILYLSNTDNPYRGNTSITAGTLSVAGGGSLGASGSLAIANATLDFSGSGTFARTIALTGAGVNTIEADSGPLTLSGAISGSGGLTKTGNGTLVLSSAANSFGGGTFVNSGTLLDNDPTGSVLGSNASGNGLVLNGGQLSGTGTITQPTTLNGGSISPGSSSAIGTLNLAGGLIVKGGTLTFRLQDDGASDTLDFSQGIAGLIIPSSTFATVDISSNPLPADRQYELMTGDKSNSGLGYSAAFMNQHLTFNCPLGFGATWSAVNIGPNGSNYFVALSGPTQWQTGSGSIADDANWSNAAPSNLGGIALLGSSGSGTVSLPSGGYCLHGLIFSNTASSYTLAASGSGGLSLTGVDELDTYTGTGLIEVVNGSHSITAPVLLAADTTVTGYDPTVRLTITGAVSGTGSLTLVGPGSLILAGCNTYDGGTIVAGGTLCVGASDSLPQATSLAVGAGGILIFDPTICCSPVKPAAAWESRLTGVPAVPEPGTLAILLAGSISTCVAAIWRRCWLV